MSIWTHVAGVVRIDAFEFEKDYPETRKEIEQALGQPTIDWNNDYSNDVEVIRSHENCKLPRGSEGSIQYEIVQTGKQHIRDGRVYSSSASAFAVVFWGDLRDYEFASAQTEIKQWWDNLLKRFMIRQAILTVETEGYKPFTLEMSYSPDHNSDE